MKNVLFVLTEWGYWGEELIGPLEACEKAGYKIEFLTPTGDKPTVLTVRSGKAVKVMLSASGGHSQVGSYRMPTKLSPQRAMPPSSPPSSLPSLPSLMPSSSSSDVKMQPEQTRIDKNSTRMEIPHHAPVGKDPLDVKGAFP